MRYLGIDCRRQNLAKHCNLNTAQGREGKPLRKKTQGRTQEWVILPLRLLGH